MPACPQGLSGRLPQVGSWAGPRRKQGAAAIEGGQLAASASERSRTGSDRYVRVSGIAQHVAAAPDGLDIVLAAGGRLQLLSQLTDEHIDDFELGLVHAAIKMVEEHLLGERRALAQREQLQHLVFFAREVHALTVYLHRLGVEVHFELAGLDYRLRVPL